MHRYCRKAALAACYAVSHFFILSAAPASAQTADALENVEPGVGINAASAHIDLLREAVGNKADQFAPGVAVKGPVTVTIARRDGTTKKYIGARDILYFATPASVAKTENLMTFEGAIIIKMRKGGDQGSKIEQGVITVSGAIETDI